MEVFFSKLIGFEKSLKGLRSRCVVDSVEFTTRILFLFEVQTYVSQKHNLERRDTLARVVYV